MTYRGDEGMMHLTVHPGASLGVSSESFVSMEVTNTCVIPFTVSYAV